jgi:hypothetical protein
VSTPVIWETVAAYAVIALIAFYALLAAYCLRVIAVMRREDRQSGLRDLRETHAGSYTGAGVRDHVA